MELPRPLGFASGELARWDCEAERLPGFDFIRHLACRVMIAATLALVAHSAAIGSILVPCHAAIPREGDLLASFPGPVQVVPDHSEHPQVIPCCGGYCAAVINAETMVSDSERRFLGASQANEGSGLSPSGLYRPPDFFPWRT